VLLGQGQVNDLGTLIDHRNKRPGFTAPTPPSPFALAQILTSFRECAAATVEPGYWGAMEQKSSIRKISSDFLEGCF
jgi:hypothetical protein